MSNKQKAAVMYAHGKVIFRNKLTPIVLPAPLYFRKCILSCTCTSMHPFMSTRYTQSLDALESYSSQAQDLLSKSVRVPVRAKVRARVGVRCQSVC